ncbi:MAG TPA: helix-turn-helix transcriptional regulator [Acidimicrobiia bacterium]|nr:helix-turn-helix transcriptional regulator [Acidimicrobiia bacterium]
MDVGATLRAARRRAHLTQRELATKTGVAQPTIARIEQGKANPRVDTIERLLRACGVTLRAGPRHGQGVDRTLIRSTLRMSPAQRLDAIESAGRGFGDLFQRSAEAPRR